MNLKRRAILMSMDAAAFLHWQGQTDQAYRIMMWVCTKVIDYSEENKHGQGGSFPPKQEEENES